MRTCLKFVNKGTLLVPAAVAAAPHVSAANPAMPVMPPAIYDVTNYGAIGDGATDDTTNIQNAINAANAGSINFQVSGAPLLFYRLEVP